MTFRLVNNARYLVFLIGGREKAGVLKELLSGPPDKNKLPAAGIKPLKGRLLCLADREAASQLPPSEKTPAPSQ